jgi:hypothetical protein
MLLKGYYKLLGLQKELINSSLIELTIATKLET